MLVRGGQKNKKLDSELAHCFFPLYCVSGVTTKKCRTRRDNAGAVCNSGMGMLFLFNLIFYMIFFKEGGFIFFINDAWWMMHDAWCIMHDAWCKIHNGCLVVLASKCRLFCTLAHARCRVHFFYHVKFFFRFRQLIGFPVWGQFCCGCQVEES